MPNLARGDRLCGRFTLMAKIGVGGHSEVWRARDIVRREDVALKILKRDPESSGAWAVLEHEYLYWVGCAGSFDDRNKKTSRPVAKLLQRAGIDFALGGSNYHARAGWNLIAGGPESHAQE